MSETDVKTVLGLRLPTDPRWVDLATISLEDILTDHAYCEQKAATSCITIIQRYPQHTELVEKLAPLVTEEWGHFRIVLAEIKKRGLSLGMQRKDLYVNGLIAHQIKDGHPDDRLLDKLLIFALIEARSCERFRLLSEKLEEAELRKFYYKFMVSEAGHYRLFIDLAKMYCQPDKVDQRWAAWLEIEKKVLNSLEIRGDRIH